MKSLKAPKGSKIIPVDWPHSEILVIFNDKQREEVGKQFHIPQDDPFYDLVGGMASLLFMEGVPFYLLFLPSKDIFTIIHECVHMVHMMFDHTGIPIEGSNTETMAYMTSHLCRQVCKCIGVSKVPGIKKAKNDA